VRVPPKTKLLTERTRLFSCLCLVQRSTSKFQHSTFDFNPLKLDVSVQLHSPQLVKTGQLSDPR
jgi:hypothetical protein